MSKAGEKLIAGATEALAVVRGELSAHSITMYGRTYVPIEEWEAMKVRAITAETRVKHLEDVYINPDL